MKTILVFGIEGFIGRHYKKYLNQIYEREKYNIIGCGRTVEKKEEPEIFYKACDITKYDEVESIFNEVKPSFVLNFAGTFDSNYQKLMDQNVKGSKNILKAAHTTGLPKKILLVGSAAEYGIPLVNPVTELHPENPVSLYGLSKLYQTELARFYFRLYKVPVLIARPFNIYGSGISEKLSIGNFKKQISETEDGGVLRVGNLLSYRDFLPVSKVVEYIHYLIEYGKPGEAYNICSGKPMQMKQVLQDLIKESGKVLSVTTDPDLLKKNDVNMIYGSCEKLSLLQQLPLRDE